MNMKSQISTVKATMLSFHREEKGDVMQNVLVVLLAAIILIAIARLMVPDLFDKVKNQVNQLFGVQINY